MLESYAPLLFYAVLLSVVGGGMIGITVVLPRVLGIRKATAVKVQPYECGVPPLVEGARGRLSVRFYLVAILFILFDIETVFLIPWAVTFKGPGAGLAAFIEVLVFVGILVLAYIYVWKRGALEWE